MNAIEKLQSLRDTTSRQEAELLSKVKDELYEKLKELLPIYRAMGTVPWKEKRFVRVLDALWLTSQTQKGSTVAAKQRIAGARSKVSDDDILAFLSSEKSTGEVVKHFKVSAVTASIRLGKLAKAKKISARKEGTSKVWKKV